MGHTNRELARRTRLDVAYKKRALEHAKKMVVQWQTAAVQAEKDLRLAEHEAKSFGGDDEDTEV